MVRWGVIGGRVIRSCADFLCVEDDWARLEGGMMDWKRCEGAEAGESLSGDAG